MAKNRGQLRTMVINQTGRSDKTDVINDALDFAQEHLTEVHDFLDAMKLGSVTLTSGSTSVAAPSDFKVSNQARTHKGIIVSISAIDTATEYITTSSAHGLTSGDLITISGNTGSVPVINGSGQKVTVINTTSFTLDTSSTDATPINITTGTADGSVITGDSSMSPIEEITLRDFLTTFPSYRVSSQSGRPTWFAYDREGGNLVFAPKTDQAYTLNLAYYKLGAAFSATLPETDDDTAFPVISGSEEALVAYASAYVWRSLQAFKDAERWDIEYDRQLTRLVSSDQRTPGINRMAKGRGYSSNTPPPDFWNDPFVFSNFERES